MDWRSKRSETRQVVTILVIDKISGELSTSIRASTGNLSWLLPFLLFCPYGKVTAYIITFHKELVIEEKMKDKVHKADTYQNQKWHVL